MSKEIEELLEIRLNVITNNNNQNLLKHIGIRFLICSLLVFCIYTISSKVYEINIILSLLFVVIFGFYLNMEAIYWHIKKKNIYRNSNLIIGSLIILTFISSILLMFE